MNFSDAVKDLFSDYNEGLRRFVTKKLGNPDDAAEIVQDTFYNYLRKGEAEPVDCPRAFLYQTANNLALNHIRKAGYREAHIQTHVTDDCTPSLEREVFAQMDIDELQKHIKKLPELTKTIFLMSRMESKTYADISKELNISISSVEKQIMKALKFLRGHFEYSE